MGPQVIQSGGAAGETGMGRARVLLADANIGDLSVCQTLLQKLGFEVRACASHQKAMECLESGVFDLIVVSQGSRAFEGRSVLARAIELNRRTPVLIVTDLLDMGCYLEAMQLGAIDYLEKPMKGPEFLDAVRSHLSSRRSPL